MRLTTLAVLAPIALFAACSSSSKSNVVGNDTTSTNPPNPPGNAASVTIADFMYTPSSVTIAKGGSVTWINNGPSIHTVVSDSTAGSTTFNSGQIIAGNSATGAAAGTFTVTFPTAGTYAYHCAIHPYMKGTVVVR